MFDGNDEINGFVLNFKQKEPYTGNYFVGLMPEKYPKWGRGDRADVRFYPAGAKSKERSNTLQSVKPKNNAIFSFSAGQIDPQPIHIVLPDGVTRLPQPFHEAQAEGVPSLGAVLQKMFYSNQAVMDMLQAYAEKNPDRISEMQQVYQDSDLTSEKKLDDVAKVVSTVLENTNNGRRKQ